MHAYVCACVRACVRVGVRVHVNDCGSSIENKRVDNHADITLSLPFTKNIVNKIVMPHSDAN